MSLSYALLGLLNYFPMSGYDLKKVFDDSINFFWPAQTSQIYRELKALEKTGYVVSMAAPSDKGPDRRVYKITESGLSRLKEWLADPPDDIDENMRNGFMVRVFFSSHVGVGELYFQVQKKLKAYKKELQMIKSVENQMADYARLVTNLSEPNYWKIVLNRGFHDVEAKIRWAEETLEYLKNQQSER